MSKYSENNFLKSFSFALRGIRIAFKSQPNVKRQLFIGLVAFVTAYFLHFNKYEFILLLMMCAMVIAAEMFNSAIEFSIDAVLKNKYSKLAGMAKDIAAGAVFITSLAALIVGILLFGSKLLSFI